MTCPNAFSLCRTGFPRHELNAFSLSQTWTEKGNKLLPSRTDSARLLNVFWTGLGFSMYGYGFDRNNILPFLRHLSGFEQVEMGLNGFEREFLVGQGIPSHFPNTLGLRTYSSVFWFSSYSSYLLPCWGTQSWSIRSNTYIYMVPTNRFMHIHTASTLAINIQWFQIVYSSFINSYVYIYIYLFIYL